MLAGALFHPLLATLLLTFLTTVGSVIATALSAPLAPTLSRFFPRALDMTRNALEGETDLAAGSASRSPAWVRLSILRLIGVVPWSGINIACGVCGVPLSDCFLGAFIGGLPWTAVTCQVCVPPSSVSNRVSFVPRSATFFKQSLRLLHQDIKLFLPSSLHQISS